MDTEGDIDEKVELLSPFSSQVWADDELNLFLDDFNWYGTSKMVTIEENVGL
jgi:hypothetical protein